MQTNGMRRRQITAQALTPTAALKMASNTRGGKRSREQAAPDLLQGQALGRERQRDLGTQNHQLEAKNAWLEAEISALVDLAERETLEKERLARQVGLMERQLAALREFVHQRAPGKRQAPGHQQDSTSSTHAHTPRHTHRQDGTPGGGR
jgi:predicted  nucleic acid-binding Zn-ribbon protein